MKVLAINGSAKDNGNTAYAISVIGEQLKAEGIELEVVTVGKQPVRACIGCNGCFKAKNKKCVFDDDIANSVIEKMAEADGIILASPTHFAGITGSLKGLLDRAFYVHMANGLMFRHKVGAAMIAVRRSGGMTALDCLNKYLFYSEMLVASANYWNVIHGAAIGEAEEDGEGNQIARLLGKNMAWMLKLKDFGKGAVPEPEAEKKVTTSFIR